MNDINEWLRKNAFKTYRYTIKNNTYIIDTDKGHFVLKKKDRNNMKGVYDYLDSRSFNYYPKLINDKSLDYDIFEYVNEIDTPKEQKAIDIINLISLLHNKTTYYEEVNPDKYKEIYEDILDEIRYLYNYYNDLISIIEQSIYMSPSEYLIARNISKIFGSLTFCELKIEEWYELVKDKKRQRLVTVHNNLHIDHLLREKNPYLISWNKAKTDMPIYDFYKFYKNHYFDFDFIELFKLYNAKYPLLEEEKILLFIFLSMPEKLELKGSEYERCKYVSKKLYYIYKSESLISPKEETQNNTEKTANFND